MKFLFGTPKGIVNIAVVAHMYGKDYVLRSSWTICPEEVTTLYGVEEHPTRVVVFTVQGEFKQVTVNGIVPTRMHALQGRTSYYCTLPTSAEIEIRTIK